MTYRITFIVLCLVVLVSFVFSRRIGSQTPCNCPCPTPTATPTVTPTPAPTPSGNTITLDPSEMNQIMVGWEATAQAGQFYSDWNSYKDNLMDQVVADGINRLRIELKYNVESISPNQATAVNDNSSPFVINPTGFQWGNKNGIDAWAEVVNMMRVRLAARGEPAPYVVLCYVDFNSSSAFEHHTNPEEYAELMEAAFLRLNSMHGWVPDAIELLLEADKTSNVDWTLSTSNPNGAKLAAVLIATRNRLAQHGWFPKFIGPSTTLCDKADVFFNAVKAANPSVVQYISEMPYHRYGGGVGCTQAMVDQNRAVAEANGISLSMLERIGATYHTLHTDLKLNNNVAWQQYALGLDSVVTGDDGTVLYLINHSTHTVTISSRMKFLRQYFKYIRRGAVRIGAQSGNVNFDPVAFINTDGKYVVVVKATVGGTFSVKLPAGSYGIFYTTATRYDVQLPDQVIGNGGSVTTSIPAAGAITVFAK